MKRGSGFDFDENKGICVFGNNIDFTQPGAIIGFDNLITGLFQAFDRKRFTLFTKFLPLCFHLPKSGYVIYEGI
jgi:hypothetical protein